MGRRTVLGSPIRCPDSPPPVLQVNAMVAIITVATSVCSRGNGAIGDMSVCHTAPMSPTLIESHRCRATDGLDREGQTGNPRRSRQGRRSASLRAGHRSTRTGAVEKCKDRSKL